MDVYRTSRRGQHWRANKTIPSTEWSKKNKIVGAMGLAFGRVECNGPVIGANSTSLGTKNHETVTNEITLYLQPPK